MRPRQLGAALLYILLWSSGFIPSRVLLREVSPLWAATVRLGAAGAVLAALAILLGSELPRKGGQLVAIGVIGIATNVVYLGLLYLALRRLSSGMAAIVASTNPLFLALVAPSLLREPLTRRKLVGTLIGFGGVVFLMAARAGSSTDRPGDSALALIAVLGLVASSVVYKRADFGPNSLVAVTAAQLAIGALVLLPTAMLAEQPWPALPTSAAGWSSMAYLVLVMSVGASLLWFGLLGSGEASRVSAFYFLTPVFGLVLGNIVLGEPLGLGDALGAAGIAIGIALVQSEAFLVSRDK